MVFRLFCGIVVFFLSSAGTIAHAKEIYIVSEGDTLWKISRLHGCELDTVKKLNNLSGSQLKIGQKLAIRTCKKADRKRVTTKNRQNVELKNSTSIVHTIETGDTLGSIAARYGTSVRDIQRRNALNSSTKIFPGNAIHVLPGSGNASRRVVLGQSVGRTNHGKLLNASRLIPGKGYFIRRSHRTYGASHTVNHTKRIVSRIRRRFPKIHALAIGDISARKGGKISMHASHQSGRDIDLGFYFNKKPKGYPAGFIVATEKNLHFRATWALLQGFASLADAPTGVEKIFMSYSTQRIIYKMAVKKKISKSVLRKMFQYPNGSSSVHGLIRHEPGHDEHIHVRFKCPPGDSTCE